MWLGLQIEIVRGGDSLFFSRANNFGHGDESVYIRNGNGSPDDQVRKAEHCGVGADSNSKREDDDGGETQVSAQQTRTEAQILQQRVKPRLAALVAVSFLGLLH